MNNEGPTFYQNKKNVIGKKCNIYNISDQLQ